MPILTTRATVPPPPPPVVDGGGTVIVPDLTGVSGAAAVWIAPNGEAWNLTDDPHVPGVITLPGVAGIEAAPRTTSRRPKHTGGTFPRWSHVDERMITWPVLVAADSDPAGFRTLWRNFVRAFTMTTPGAGVPSPGMLRINREDGTWREVAAIYDDGLRGVDDSGMGLDKRTAVISLIAEPWWYGPETVAISFIYSLARAYVGTTGGSSGTDPYETVSPSNTQGTSTVEIIGDTDALPTWTLSGPASSFTVAIPDHSWTYTETLMAGDQVIIDVANLTVTSAAGANKIGNLSWPSSELFTLPTGSNTVDITINGAAAGASVILSYRPAFECS